ncbi:MAG: hypothetical protein GY761_01930, partial [Hyphomicrobiales bacterium]|nr:hypothetical protein [Hyphomicrobiales bacterium]
TFSTYDYGSSSIHGVALSINWEHGGESHQLRLANGGQHIETYEFADGKVVSRFAHYKDVENLNNWSTCTYFYDDQNRLFEQVGTYDSGNTWHNVWDVDNVETWAQKSTNDDTANLNNWSTCTYFYDDQNRLFEQVGTYDSGNTWHYIWDVDNVETWAQQSYLYDPLDNLISIETVGSNSGESLGSASTSTTQILQGLGGDDTLVGGSGADRLTGGAGNDLLAGGAGADTFHFEIDGDHDTITDFEDDIDIIDLSSFGYADAATALTYATEADGDVTFDFGNGDLLTIENVTKAQLNTEIVAV